MSKFPRIVLRDKKADAVRRFHPWIFSGAIKSANQDLKDGDIVEVYGEQDDYLATGHYNTGNIAVKILSFQPVTTIDHLFHERFQQAYELRKQLGLAASDHTNCYRLINSEGDGLPGLIVDWYNGAAVVQTYSVGMYEQRQLIGDCLKALYGQTLHTIYDKSGTVLPKNHLPESDPYLSGNQSQGEVLENGHRFLVNWEEGQKTGFFIDQRDHRQLLAHHAPGKRVLNTFSYSGGFSAYATRAGARLVHSVDSSTKAIDLATQNVAFNNPEKVLHEAFVADVFDFLKTSETDYDVIVLDPPAFAKNLSARHQAMMAYKRLNKLAFSRLKPGGMVFTFSCSQVVTQEHFQGAVTAAAIEAGRPTRILAHLTQPADHPVSIFHPEGLYLKGLVLQVEGSNEG